MKKFNLVVIGSMTRDRIVIGKKKGWYAPGGGVYYSAFPPAGMELPTGERLKVAVITKLARKDSSLLDKFREEGIEVFPSWSEETTQMENIYPEPGNPDKRIARCVVLPTPFELIKNIPADIEAEVFFITTLLKGEIPLEIVRELSRKKGIIALDVQGFMRSLQGKSKEEWKEKDEILPLVDILKVDKREAEMLTGEKDPKKALRILAFSGLKEIVLTHSRGVLVYAQREIYPAAFTGAITIEGRTGRGDTVMGAYLCERLLGTSPESACRIAAWICSLKMESEGPYKGLEDYTNKTK